MYNLFKNDSILYVFRILRCFPRFLLYLFQNLICPPIFCLWFFTLQPLKFFNFSLFNRIFGRAFDAYLIIVSSWLDFSGHSVYECGDNIANLAHDESLLIVNHQSPTDIGTMMRVLQDKDFVFSRVVWIMDWLIQFFHFGWVSKAHGDFFLLQVNDANRLNKIFSFDIGAQLDIQTVKLRRNIRNNFSNRNKKWIMLFPEGGFLKNRRPGSQRYAKKNNLPVLEHVALPRTGAFFEIIDTLGIATPDVELSSENQRKCVSSICGDRRIEEIRKHRIKWIIDVTIGYDRPIGVFEYIFGAFGPRQVIVHFKCFPAFDIFGFRSFQTDEEKESLLRDWLYARYAEKEELLSYFYKYNNFPVDAESSGAQSVLRYPRLDYTVLLLIQLLSFGSFYLLVRFTTMLLS